MSMGEEVFSLAPAASHLPPPTSDGMRVLSISVADWSGSSLHTERAGGMAAEKVKTGMAVAAQQQVSAVGLDLGDR